MQRVNFQIVKKDVIGSLFSIEPSLLQSTWVLVLLFCSSLAYAQPAFNATTMDTPIDEFATFSGNHKVAIGGASLYPSLTAASFDVNVPACTGGTPTVVAAYLTWFHRVADIPQGAGEFDSEVDVSINSSAPSSVTYTNKFDVSFPNGSEYAEYFHLIADVTALVQANLTGGVNTFDISDVNPPTNGTWLNNNYGTAITIIYECPEFDNVKTSYFAGNDFFYELNPSMGTYSSSYCFSFDAEPAARTLNIDAYVGGQANLTAPFRGGTYSYITGTGAAPAMDGSTAIPTGTIWNPTNATPNPTWQSNPGHEWDLFSNTITIPAGDTYICIQSRSHQDFPATVGGGSLNNVAFTFTLPVAESCTAPTATASAANATCTTGTANSDASITIAAFTAGQRYQYSTGGTFASGSAIPAGITAIPVGGVIENTLANATGTYTVRIYDATDDACFVDRTVTITLVDCTIPCVTPDAGEDVAICLPKTTTNLADAPAGTEWMAETGNPAAASIDATTGEITGLTATGVYTFRLQSIGDPTCSSTMNVSVTNGDAPNVLCNDGSTSVTLEAPANLTNVRWYSMDGTEVGTGNSLIVTSNTGGLADGTEAYYYIGEDGAASGCDVELCCPVKFLTQDCCPTPNCASVTVIKN